MLPNNRGDFDDLPSGALIYKDNIVQYNGSSYIYQPADFDIEHPEESATTSAPYDDNPFTLNTGWKVFASGNNTFTTGEKVNNVGIDNEPTNKSGNLVKSNGVEQMCKKNSEDVFNLNKIDWVYKRSISLTPDRARPIIGHLYKQICTFTIKGNINGNSIVVSGTNVATGNIINLYNNSNPNFPITFQNPRPELNLENITIFLPSTSVSDTFDIEITKDSPFDKITQDQELNVDNDRKLFDDVALISQGITVSLANSSSYQRIDFKQGVKYKLQSNTNTARTISFWSFDKSSMIQNFAIPANGIALFTPLSDAFWIKSGDIFSGVLYSEINLPDLQDKINTLKTEDTNNKDDIFSLQNEQSLISEQGLNINLLNNSIYQRVDFKGGNKYKLVSTTNAARTITLWPLDKSSYIQAITVGANKTVLFTANSDASWIKSGDTFTGILYANSNFKDITEDIDNLENDVALIDGNGINVNLPLPTTYQRVYLKQGRKYLIKSTTNSTRSLTIWPLDKSSAIQVITANANKTVSFIPNADASWIKSGDTFTGVLYDAYNVFVLQDEIDSTNDRIDNIESNDILQSVYQFSRDSDDWIYEETKNCNRDSNTIFLPYLGQQKCHITVSGNVSPNKFKVIATNKETGNQIWLYDGTEGAQLPITFNNPRAEVELLNVGIQIGSQGTTDDITLKIVKESPIAVLKDKVKITSLQQERLKFPMYQFGVGIDIKYETPLCDGFTLPAQLSRVSFFHGLYDQLTTQYPNYITKVDCDSECEAAGIERPSYMEDYPIYMYKFIPPYTPTSGGVDQSTSKSRFKVFIVTGTHPEYMAIYDCYQTMKRICESWQANDNLDALRNEAEYYIIPCSGPWGVDHASRVNYNGVDLNRNAPASNWRLTDNDGYQYSGPEPASEYETKILVHYMEEIQPQVFIDHHNFADNSKNSIYMSSNAQGGVDVGAAHISAMTRRWKLRFSSVFPNDATIFGFAQITRETGTRGWYGSDAGAWGFTYESAQNLNYTNGELTPSTPHGLSDSTSCTIATDGFLNFLLRVLKTYSEKH